MNQISHLPSAAGTGFKPRHFPLIAAAQQPVGFFEIHAENYMGAGGRPHAQLQFLRTHYALSVHGVGLSIGSSQRLDSDHLARLKHLCNRYEPESVSEHLAWSSHNGAFFNDLLPLPYTLETLTLAAAHIDEIQSALGRQILLENPATYVRFAQSTMTEAQFLDELVSQTGCGLLLDVNNIYVSAINHGVDPLADLMAFPFEHVREIHLAGHSETHDAGPRLLIDSHGAPVASPVMALYAEAISQTGAVATLIEWDNDVPDWPQLLSEARAAQKILDTQNHHSTRAA